MGLGACVGILLSFTLGMYFILKQARALTGSVPGARLFENVTRLAVIVFPLTGLMFSEHVLSLMTWVRRISLTTWSCQIGDSFVVVCRL